MVDGGGKGKPSQERKNRIQATHTQHQATESQACGGTLQGTEQLPSPGCGVFEQAPTAVIWASYQRSKQDEVEIRVQVERNVVEGGESWCVGRRCQGCGQRQRGRRGKNRRCAGPAPSQSGPACTEHESTQHSGGASPVRAGEADGGRRRKSEEMNASMRRHYVGGSREEAKPLRPRQHGPRDPLSPR